MKIIKNDLKTKESGPGAIIVEFSVKLRFEWWYFRRIKTKPCPVCEKKTVLQYISFMKIIKNDINMEDSGPGTFIFENSAKNYVRGFNESF